MVDPVSESTRPDVTSQPYVNTLTHFYRGELGRMMVWRERFDATTNWAIVATGSLVAYAVGNPEMANAAMFINLFVLGFFSFLEARRFRFYDAYRARVRMLETHFIAPTLLGHDRRLLEGNWRERLAADLMQPTFKCSLIFALGRRFKRVYFALHGFVLLFWFALVLLRPESATFSGWVRAFKVQWISGEAVLLALATYYIVLTVLLVRSGALHPGSGEARYDRALLDRDI